MHGAEAAKVDLPRKPKLLGRRLDLPLEDVPASKRRAIAATEDEIFRLVELRLGPDPREGFLKDPLTIKRHLSVAAVRFGFIEVVFVEALVDDDAIVPNVVPA